MNKQHLRIWGSSLRRILALAAVGCFVSSVTWAARVDWDGGTADTNTVTGGSANTAINWSSDLVPVTGDDVFLNDVVSGSAAVRAVTVDSGLTWRSLTINQSTAPGSGANSNILSIAAGTSLVLTGSTPLSVSGAINAPGVVDLGNGGILAFSNTVLPVVTFGPNTVLTGNGVIANMANQAMLMTLSGTLMGSNSIQVGLENRTSRLVLGSSAVISGVQTWTHVSTLFNCTLSNCITTASQWLNEAVTLNTYQQGLNLEAATATDNPGPASHFKFARININTGGNGASQRACRFYNTLQNDGGTPGIKEAVYAGTWNGSALGDGSGGHQFLDLNGQDLYVDRFTNMVSFNSRAMRFGNNALNSTSSIRAVTASGDTLFGGSFMIANNATLEIVGGSWFDTIYMRYTSEGPGDNAAAANSISNDNISVTRRWDGFPSVFMAAAHHFLGSGGDKAGNTGTAWPNTAGTLRIVGGDYASSGNLLNPLNATGTIDTLSSNPSYPDTVLNTVMIRPNTIQSVTNISIISGVMQAPGHRFLAGSPVYMFAGTIPTGLVNFNKLYYVVNPTDTSFQLAASPGGAPIVPTTQGGTVGVQDSGGLSVAGTINPVYPALIVAGRSTIVGNLALPVIGGAKAVGVGANLSAPINQATLRVGGVVPVQTAMTADPATDSLTLTSGSVTNGQAIYLSGANAPTGLVFGLVYYARDAVGSAFKVAAWPGEPAIDITSTGVGVTNVAAIATNSATLMVTGDLTLESRAVTGYFGVASAGVIGIAGIAGDGATVTVTNSTIHGLVTGDTITVAGGNAGFNGTFTVTSVPSLPNFTYAAAASGPGGNASISFSKVRSVNVAIQSNGTVKVGGNVLIGGVGQRVNNLVTGLGVGIDPASQFIVNGGLTVTQSVAIVPPVGCFHVGEGTNGVLTGTAARALLTTNLVVAGSLDVNGASVVTGATAAVSIILTNGADAVLGAASSLAIDGVFSAGSGSEVNLSAGAMSVGTLDLSGGGVIDFKTRMDLDGALRVKNDVRTQLQAAIAAGTIRHSNKPLGVTYNAAQGYTTIRLSLMGTRLEIY